jgi:amidophosphoribosyltransferase
MSDQLQHECGIAMLHIKRPDLHASIPSLGLKKMYLLMEKLHNRGQDGAGLASFSSRKKVGETYLLRARSVAAQPIKDLFKQIEQRIKENESERDVFHGDLFMGHLRYGTHGKNILANCHPFIKESNWRSKFLCLAGNFNLTNTSELFNQLVELGQHPRMKSDTVTVMERLGYFLDRLADDIISKTAGTEIKTNNGSIDLTSLLKQATQKFDGGFVIGGILGTGQSFCMRDAHGIRPAFYYENEDFLVIASERAAIQTVFNAAENNVTEIPPGHALITDSKKNSQIIPILEPRTPRKCSFERIYFSRGTDSDIYQERKSLGREICSEVLEKIKYDFGNTVFSYIPNTAETAFLGLLQATENYLIQKKVNNLINANTSELDRETYIKLLEERPRVEKIAVKDVKLRTFIAEEGERSDLIQHVYDITYGSIRPYSDTLVILDDSIVRGATLKDSILTMLGRLNPKKILVVSSAPQVRYPDFYGIDMASLDELLAFRAAIQLLKSEGREREITELGKRIEMELQKPANLMQNRVKELYEMINPKKHLHVMSENLLPENAAFQLELCFQKPEALHKAIPEHTGDWYFSGNYPTPGGIRLVNLAFLNFLNGIKGRAFAN